MSAVPRRERPPDVEQIAEQFIELVTEERILLATLRRIRQAKLLALSTLAAKATEAAWK